MRLCRRTIGPWWVPSTKARILGSLQTYRASLLSFRASRSDVGVGLANASPKSGERQPPRQGNNACSSRFSLLSFATARRPLVNPEPARVGRHLRTHLPSKNILAAAHSSGISGATEMRRFIPKTVRIERFTFAQTSRRGPRRIVITVAAGERLWSAGGFASGLHQGAAFEIPTHLCDGGLGPQAPAGSSGRSPWPAPSQVAPTR